jgi:hypothetical protein
MSSKIISGKRFEGRVVIVTASTQGIGFSTAERFGLEGASVVISSRKQVLFLLLQHFLLFLFLYHIISCFSGIKVDFFFLGLFWFLVVLGFLWFLLVLDLRKYINFELDST